MMPASSPKLKQQGFTLVELMIVLALSSILSAALFQVFLGNKKNVELLESYSRIQEASRYSLDYLARDIRMAGYMGCVNSNMSGGKITNMLDPNDAKYDASLHGFASSITAIDNFDPGNPAHVSTFPGISPVAGSDVFITSGAMPTDLLVRTAHSSTSATMQVQGPDSQLGLLRKGMLLMVTDCNTGHIFSVSNTNVTGGARNVVHNKVVSDGPDNRQAGFGVNYVAGSQLLVMNTTAYFVAPSALVPGKNSLYRLSSMGGVVAQELVPYVDDMQLLYAVDTNGDRAPDVYKTARQIANDGDSMEEDVYAVSIDLVVSGHVDIDAESLAGYANDGKLRKRYSRVVNIRNAGIASY